MADLMEIGSIYEMTPGSAAQRPEVSDQKRKLGIVSAGQRIGTGKLPYEGCARQPETKQKRRSGVVCDGQMTETESSQKHLYLKEVHKYGRGNISYTASGREAIALALKSMEKNHPELVRRCLMPAYMCDSVFFPFERAGWELIFYPVGEDLRADREVLSALIRERQPGLLFVHTYYGVDTWQHLRPYFADWKKQGLRIMEDVTQSYYLETGGQGADDIVGSLRKWYPVPDGGFVASNDPIEQPWESGQEEAAAARTEILTEKWRYLHDSQEWQEGERTACKQHFLSANRQMEEALDHQQGARAMSSISMEILSGIEEAACKKRRQENYRKLCSFFRNREGWSRRRCRMLLEETEQAAPLYLPVMAEDRDGLQRHLVEQQIFAPVLWPVGKENAPFLTAAEQEIYGHMLALPMDQRYGEQEMVYIGRALERYMR